MNILDTTIRDGSYAIDFKFSLKDVKSLVKKSNKIGIEYIEVGHGMGLNASSAKYGEAMHSDEEYMYAAKEVAGDSKVGVFFNPNIASYADIKKAKNCNIDFIRMGVTVQEYGKAIPFISKCREEGMFVFANFMKTYASAPEDFASASKALYEEGAQCVYIVDSAGCMTEEDIGKYIDAARNASDVMLGYHGHNNLGLAVSNSLYCVKRGMEFIDGSFQGLGRSIGNASIEQLVMALEKYGYKTGFDIPRVLEYGYSSLRTIVRDKLVNPLDYVCAYAGFHSGFIKDIYKCCNEKSVDPLRLIIAYCAEDKLTIDYDRLCEVAEKLPKDVEDNPYGFAEFFSEKYND